MLSTVDIFTRYGLANQGKASFRIKMVVHSNKTIAEANKGNEAIKYKNNHKSGFK